MVKPFPFMLASVMVLVALASAAPRPDMAGLGIPTARAASQTASGASEAIDTDAGIPIPSKLVQNACLPCHKVDDQQRISRISYRRTTPEGWQQTLKRMVALNGLEIDPDTARQAVKILSNHAGLAPEELRPAAFEVERRLVDYTYEADPDTEETCTRCHSFGRVLTERRTKDDWALLLAMHRGFYPLVDFQAFRRSGRRSDDASAETDSRHPMDKAIDHLSSVFPLKTPEWTAWSKTMRPPVVEGRWAVHGYAPGKGPFHGLMTIEATKIEDEFTTRTELVDASGQKVVRTGNTIIYTGYQWRGRSSEAAPKATDNDGDGPTLREVMFVDADWRTISGRWFTGAYDELGMDVSLRRLGTGPAILGLDQWSLKAPSSVVLRIDGVNLPARLAPTDFDFGRGITVERVVRAQPDRAEVEIDVAAGTPPGLRSVFVAGAPAPKPIAVYDRIDRIAVVPQAGMARVGGIVFPKQFEQFEAVAFHNGPDNRPETGDDLELGRVDVDWSLEEYSATFHDDDIRFVGTLDENGFFTPNVDGPNPNRRNNANNVGDVWVVATHRPAGEPDARALRARAHLLVTVPLYMRFDQPEIHPQ